MITPFVSLTLHALGLIPWVKLRGNL